MRVLHNTAETTVFRFVNQAMVWVRRSSSFELFPSISNCWGTSGGYGNGSLWVTFFALLSMQGQFESLKIVSSILCVFLRTLIGESRSWSLRKHENYLLKAYCFCVCLWLFLLSVTCQGYNTNSAQIQKGAHNVLNLLYFPQEPG